MAHIYDQGSLFELRTPMSMARFEEFVEYLRRFDIYLSEFHPDGLVEEALRQQIRQHGISSILARVRIQESLMTPRQDSDQIADLLSQMIGDLGAVQTLELIDPYLLIAGRGQRDVHVARVVRILSSSLGQISLLRIIHDPRHVDPAIQEMLASQLDHVAPGLTLDFVGSRDFHDRFVIADRRRGLVVGCSLNGLGSKYALFDMLSHEDAEHLGAVLSAL